ncbi:MAG: hypothetical protein M3552_15300 [Planctomycetota bacterium]|nr:hypothetical protein [Planctomycetaceae bacterium]MDQ3331997.1 hypothetical protein [Planctomycetota bacterium]
MACRGRVTNGTIVLDEPVDWPDGTRVLVHVGPPTTTNETAIPASDESGQSSDSARRES